MLFLLAQPALAEDCREALFLRSVLPSEGAEDVPVDIRVLVSFQGYGTDEEVEVELEGPAGAIEVEQETWCYEHEGPDEVHCWFRLKPTQSLAAEQQHTVRMRSTEAWSGEGSFEHTSRFTTGTGSAPALTGAPTLSVEPGTEELPEECAYDDPNLFLLGMQTASPDASGLSVFHVDHVLDEAERVHTVFAFADEPEHLTKQVVDGSSEACFRAVHEDGAGNQALSDTVCWPQDTGLPDSPADSPTDSPPESSAPVDSEPAQDSEGPQPRPPEPCGCGARSAVLWLLPGLLLLALGRRR